jgi:hypothetical protein
MLMKGRVLRVVLGLGLAMTFGVARADREDHATSHVFVEVNPNIAVAPDLVSVDLGGVQTGEFDGDIRFRVDANTQTVRFMACASYLYKGDDCANQDVAPIPISIPDGIVIDADNANPTGGHGDVAVYLGSPFIVTEPCFIGQKTEWVNFESSQNNHFSQYVTFTPTWIQEDPEKPMGEYSGFVSIMAMVVLRV